MTTTNTYDIIIVMLFVIKTAAPTDIYTYFHTLSLHDARPITHGDGNLVILGQPFDPRRQIHRVPDQRVRQALRRTHVAVAAGAAIEPDSDSHLAGRSEEHTSELQSLMRLSYAVFCLTNTILTLHTHTRTKHRVIKRIHT